MRKRSSFWQVFIALIFAVGIAILAGGCNTDWLGAVRPEKNSPKPKQPPAPVVVDGVRTSYADIVAKTTPAVVQITAISRGNAAESSSNSPFDELTPFPPGPRQEQRPTRGLGSGVIVKDDGTILTNHHVIEGADKITVDMNDGESFEAKVIGSDPPSDLAVLKIDGSGLPFLTLGDSDKVRIGDIVLAIGNPLGIGQTVTSGIISAKSRSTGLGSSFQDFLQTDAAINRGNSGGALVNINGELIGINSQILSGSGGNIGIGFAIPSNMAKSVMDQLIDTGKVRRGMLGINIQNISSELAEALGLDSTKGVVVSNVVKGGAAESAGVKRGDIIRKINGEDIEDGNTLKNKVAETLPGTSVTLSIVRDGTPQDIKVKLGEYKPEDLGLTQGNGSGRQQEEPSAEQGKLGISLQPLTPEMAERLKIPSEVKGLLITAVEQGSAAEMKGLTRGDVVVEINREMVGTLDEARKAISKSGNKPVLLLISRRGQTFFVSIEPE